MACDGRPRAGLTRRDKQDKQGKQLDSHVPLADARAKLASCVGYAARQMWRRADLEDVDEIILVLLCEALQRIGNNYRPKERASASQTLRRAPSHIQDLVKSLET